jgi:hypothetical protein
MQRQTGSSAETPLPMKAFLIPAAMVSISPMVGPEGVKRPDLFSRRAVIVLYIVYPDPGKPETNPLISPAAPRRPRRQDRPTVSRGDGDRATYNVSRRKIQAGIRQPFLMNMKFRCP